VRDIGAIVTVSITLYALVTTVFLILENRRPQATLAWMLAFYLAPGIGVLIYLLFGRDRKAFSRQSRCCARISRRGRFRSYRRYCPARTARSPASKGRVPSARG
jgi:uncharacterized membrane protein YeiB